MSAWDKEDVVDGLRVIASRRGLAIQQGDVLVVEAAIVALEKTSPADRAEPGEDPVGRVRRYVAMRKEKPVYNSDDIHAVHLGTEHAAELRLSDLEATLARLEIPAKVLEALGYCRDGLGPEAKYPHVRTILEFVEALAGRKP